ncbi:MAG TPA: PQQ-binding-like beta-propeller repeat protein [Pyrinomonadaceae bacterium]|jgi:outer membrane protein assembly factor BamB
MLDETTASKHWYDSRRGKLTASLLILLLAGGAIYFVLAARKTSRAEAHYDALEQHRAAQSQNAPTGDAAQPVQVAAQPPSASGAEASPNASQGQPTAVVSNAVQPETSAAAAPAANAQAPAGGSTQSKAQAPAPVSRRNYWTSFRGPRQDGRYDEQPVKTNWGSAGPPLLWRQPVGGGYASFSVADGVAYTIEQRRGEEVVTAYQVENGRELWKHGWNALYTDSTGDGPRATPAWDEGRLYALGALGELRCLDAKTGKLIWNRNILSDNGAENIPWAMSASPLVVDDKVIVIPGGSGGKSIVAYNKMTGAPVWKTLSDRASYTSPMLVNLAGRRQVLVVTAQRAAGLVPETGAVLWEYPWTNSLGINVAQPIVVGQNRFFISAGYGKGAALVEVTGSGQNYTARTVWENTSMKNKFNSSVLHEGHVYGLDEGILTCVEAATGARKWKGGRYGYGQVVVASGHLIITSEQGEVVLVKATPEQHTEVARFPALEGRTWNNPAIAGGRLFVRNATQMACYKLTD